MRFPRRSRNSFGRLCRPRRLRLADLRSISNLHARLASWLNAARAKHLWPSDWRMSSKRARFWSCALRISERSGRGRRSKPSLLCAPFSWKTCAMEAIAASRTEFARCDCIKGGSFAKGCNSRLANSGAWAGKAGWTAFRGAPYSSFRKTRESSPTSGVMHF